MTNQSRREPWAQAIQKFESEMADLSAYIQHAPKSADGWNKEKMQDDCAAIAAWAKKNRATTAGREGLKLTFPVSPPDFVERLMTAPEGANVPGWSKEKAVKIANDLKSFVDGMELTKD
ncbi:hypothetical protein ACFWP3_17060 [Streptomyces sp. NPDC058525]|uniref:hypothetical protein n=1 Tax=Streptomyces sp. NPDC058525 TaxID=3346538 RepID=UPI0036565BC4